VLRRVLLAASGSSRLRELITTAPRTRAVVEDYVAGETEQDAVRVTRALRAAGLLVSLDYLGEATTDPAQAAAVTDEYIELLGKLGAEGLTHRGAAEVSVKPTAVGLFLGTRMARENIARICAAAREAGTTVTLDAEEFAAIEPTLRIAAELRAQYSAASSRPACGAARPTAARWRDTASGSGSARVLTVSRTAWPSPPAGTWTRPTRAACGS
jgi:proline dehydrogenase